MNFFRDRDLEHFEDGTQDPTAANYIAPIANAAVCKTQDEDEPGPSTSRFRPAPQLQSGLTAARAISRSPSKSPTKSARGISTNLNSKKRSSDAIDDAAEASLRKRMAGPSAGKAGLALDQDEINRIIYEASKGSKFFDNERKKDAQVTEQIKRMLAKRDARVQEVPEGSTAWREIEKEIGGMVARLEATRALSFKIIHCDMDAFYANVELKKDPSLKGKAFGVGGGVLVTCSYEARKFGVRSGMATFVAKALCPHLIEVKNDMPSYVAASRDIMDALAAYDENMAQASLDEAYLDLTPYCAQYSMDVEQVVAQLRNEVLEKTGLTVSVGIAPNKMLAKICSDKNKPNGQFQLQPERQAIINFMRDLPVRKVPGIGRVTERILDAMGVKTCHDVWENRVMLYLTFDGKIDWLLQAHLGLASHVVQPSQRHERKSVGRETTFRPTSNESELLGHLRDCCDQVEKDLERLEFDGRTITLIGKHDTYQRFSRAHTSSVGRHFKTADELFTVAKQHFDAEQKHAGVLCLRLIGVRLTNLRDLKQAKEGGPLTKMFRSVPSKPKTSPWGLDVGSSSDDMLLGKADAALTEDEERRQVRLALEASLREVQERDRPASDQADPSLAQDEDEVEIVEAKSVQQSCPICNRVLSFRADTSEAQINVRLNQHVDLCLSGFNDLAASPTNPASKAQTLDPFVTRA